MERGDRIIGENTSSANGTNRFDNNEMPQVISVTLSSWKKYPVDIRPVMNGSTFSAGGGMGMKSRALMARLRT